MAKQNYGGVYSNMDFAPYQYHPYPRHIITGPKGEYEVAYNEDEEKKIKDRLRKEHDDIPADVEVFLSDPEKEILISRARELEVPINRKWSKEKLITVIKDAEDAIDNLPPEGQEVEEYSPAAAVAMAEGAAYFASDNLLTVVKPPAPITELPADKDALLAKAKELGIRAQGMHLWGIPRLQATIAEFLANKA